MIAYLLKRLRGEPVFVFALAETVVGLLVALDVLSAEVGGALAAVVAVLGGGAVRQSVTPMTGVTKVLAKPVGEVNELLRRARKVLP